MKTKYNIIAFCLPDFDNLDGRQPHPWGFDFDELVQGFRVSIFNSLGRNSASAAAYSPFYLCGHDWGSVVCQYYVNKHAHDVQKLVLLDVGQDVTVATQGFLVTFVYQTWFLLAYITSQIIAFWLGSAMFRSFSLFWAFGPVPYDTPDRPACQVNVHMLYPIYYYWKQMVVEKLWGRGRGLPSFPSVPLLFLYGTKKRSMFHGQAFLSKISKTSGCRSVSLDSGHWVTHFQPQLTAQQVNSFLAES